MWAGFRTHISSYTLLATILIVNNSYTFEVTSCVEMYLKIWGLTESINFQVLAGICKIDEETIFAFVLFFVWRSTTLIWLMDWRFQGNAINSEFDHDLLVAQTIIISWHKLIKCLPKNLQPIVIKFFVNHNYIYRRPSLFVVIVFLVWLFGDQKTGENYNFTRQALKLV